VAAIDRQKSNAPRVTNGSPDWQKNPANGRCLAFPTFKQQLPCFSDSKRAPARKMRLVEQAVFTSIGNGVGPGYQVVACSPGVCQSDARELGVWGPTHDSVLDPSAEAASFNFHPLPSGSYCVSRTVSVASDAESPPRADTHCLLVPAEVLVRFGNNPLAVIDAASNRGLWQVHHPPYPPLESLSLDGGAAAADLMLLERLAVDPGPDTVAALVQAARETLCLAIAGEPNVASLLSGLFNCLPIECRVEFSFTTGLKFSPRRPFRIVAVPDDPAQRQWIASYPNVVVLDVATGQATHPTPLDGWSQLVHRALLGRQAAYLAAQVSRRRFRLTLGEVPALGLQLLEELDHLELGDFACGSATMPTSQPREAGQLSCKADTGSPAGPEGGETPPAPVGGDSPVTRSAHVAHRRFAKGAGAVWAANASPPPDPSSPETLDRLEQLDDLVYEAINGQRGAMERLEAAWPKLAAELGEELLAVSREQYLRYALSVWDQCVGADGLREPARAVQAVDVLSLIFADAK
jgi:hypothetical protein